MLIFMPHRLNAVICMFLNFFLYNGGMTTLKRRIYRLFLLFCLLMNKNG